MAKSYLDKDGLKYFWQKIKAKIPTTWAGSSTAGGVATKTASIPFGQVDSTSTSTAFTATVSGITELSDGVCVMLRNGVVTSATGWTLNINGLGAKPVYRSFAANTRVTTWFNSIYTMLFVYNSTRISGGCWDMYEGYWSDSNNIGVYNRPAYVRLKTKTALGRYVLLLSYSDTELLPVNALDNNITTSKTLTTESFDPFGAIYYYNSATALTADATIADGTLWSQRDVPLRYSFNTGTTLTTNKSVYIVATPQSDGKAKLYSTPIAQEIPATENGLIYIYLGVAYSNNQVQLNEKHPVYYYKDGAIRMWTNPYERIFTTLIPTGTAIPANANLNSIAYMKVGMYYISSDANTATLTNCPTKSAFMMEVYSPLSKNIDNETNNWVYRVRKITDYYGNMYIQSANTNGSGTFIYRAWQKIAKDSDIPSFTNYYTKTDVDDLMKSNYMDVYTENLTSITIAAGSSVKVMDYPDTLDTWDINTTRVLFVKQDGELVSQVLFPVTCQSDGIYAENTDAESVTIDSLEITLVRKDSFLDNNVFYGVCNSSANSTSKSVTCNYFTHAYPGMHFVVKFVNGVKNSGLSFFINDIYVGDIRNDANETGVAYDVRENQIVEMVYDGTYWHMLGTREATTTWYGITKLTDSVTSTSTDTAATPNSVKQAYDLANTANTAISKKQDTLVSGTNIKTINGTSVLGSGNIEISGGSSTTDIVNLIYPVGSIYLSVNSTNPMTLFGGTWTQIAKGRTLVGVDTSDTDFSTSEKTGGEKTHTLTKSELPQIDINTKFASSAGGNGSGLVYGTTTGNSNNILVTNTNYGANSHNNVQPYFTCYIWKRTA